MGLYDDNAKFIKSRAITCAVRGELSAAGEAVMNCSLGSLGVLSMFNPRGGRLHRLDPEFSELVNCGLVETPVFDASLLEKLTNAELVAPYAELGLSASSSKSKLIAAIVARPNYAYRMRSHFSGRIVAVTEKGRAVCGGELGNSGPPGSRGTKSQLAQIKHLEEAALSAHREVHRTVNEDRRMKASATLSSAAKTPKAEGRSCALCEQSLVTDSEGHCRVCGLNDDPAKYARSADPTAELRKPPNPWAGLSLSAVMERRPAGNFFYFLEENVEFLGPLFGGLELESLAKAELPGACDEAIRRIFAAASKVTGVKRLTEKAVKTMEIGNLYRKSSFHPEI